MTLIVPQLLSVRNKFDSLDFTSVFPRGQELSQCPLCCGHLLRAKGQALRLPVMSRSVCPAIRVSGHRTAEDGGGSGATGRRSATVPAITCTLQRTTAFLQKGRRLRPGPRRSLLENSAAGLVARRRCRVCVSTRACLGARRSSRCVVWRDAAAGRLRRRPGRLARAVRPCRHPACGMLPENGGEANPTFTPSHHPAEWWSAPHTSIGAP